MFGNSSLFIRSVRSIKSKSILHCFWIEVTKVALINSVHRFCVGFRKTWSDVALLHRIFRDTSAKISNSRFTNNRYTRMASRATNLGFECPIYFCLLFWMRISKIHFTIFVFAKFRVFASSELLNRKFLHRRCHDVLLILCNFLKLRKEVHSWEQDFLSSCLRYQLSVYAGAYS